MTPRPPAKRELSPELRQRFAAALRDLQERHAVFAQARRELDSLTAQLQREEEEERHACSRVDSLLAQLSPKNDELQRLVERDTNSIEHLKRLEASTSDESVLRPAREKLAKEREELLAKQDAANSLAMELERSIHECQAHGGRLVELRQQQKQAALRALRASLELNGMLGPQARPEAPLPGDAS